MTETSDNARSGSLIDKIQAKVHDLHDSSSSSDSETENEKPSSPTENEKPLSPPKKNRLFGRQQPVHAVFGGGKSADVVLWRNRRITAGIVVGVTLLWLLFDWIGYHFLTLVCHTLILSLVTLFCWSNISCAINKSPPKFPEVIVPEDLVVSVALSVRHEINRAFAVFRQVASGKDLKKFLMVVAGLWAVSVIGSWFNFLTLFYVVFMILHTVPVLYEKHEERIDSFAERAMVEANKRYALLHEKVFKKIPQSPFKDKKLL